MESTTGARGTTKISNTHSGTGWSRDKERFFELTGGEADRRAEEEVAAQLRAIHDKAEVSAAVKMMENGKKKRRRKKSPALKSEQDE
jgi:hypothetical protein